MIGTGEAAVSDIQSTTVKYYTLWSELLQGTALLMGPGKTPWSGTAGYSQCTGEAGDGSFFSQKERN